MINNQQEVEEGHYSIIPITKGTPTSLPENVDYLIID